MESFRIINIIADAVLAMKVADERVTRIKTTELSMTLGRHTPTKLVGLSIEGGDGRFVLPDEKGTLDSTTGNTAFVDSQVSFHKSSSFLKNSGMSTASACASAFRGRGVAKPRGELRRDTLMVSLNLK